MSIDAYELFRAYDLAYNPIENKCNNCLDSGFNEGMRIFGYCEECEEGAKRLKEHLAAIKRA